MRAVILAGGRGTRLQPYTLVLPKPLMPVGDLAILEIVLLQLSDRGFERVTLAVGYLAEIIRAVVGDGRRYGLAIDYSQEREPLGTAGPLGLVPELAGTFLVMNGDILTDLDYRDLVARHREAGALCTMAVHEKAVPIDLGVLRLEGDRVVAYTEKPTLSYTVSTGIYAFDARVLSFIPRGRKLDLPELVRALIDAGEKVIAYPLAGSWLDIGRPEDFARATELFAQERARFLPGRPGPDDRPLPHG